MTQLFIIPVFLFTIPAILIIPYCQYWHLNQIDEGFCLVYPAKLVSNNKYPYKDFFYNYAPAKIFFLSILFKKFGTSLKTARLMYSICPSIVAVEIYFLALILIKTPIIPFLCAFFYLIHLFPKREMYYSIPIENGLFSGRMILAMMSLIFMFLYTENKGDGFLLFAGLFSGLTLIWGLDAGIYVTISNGIMLAIGHITLYGFLLFLTGSVIFPIITIFFLISKGVLIRNMFEETLGFMFPHFKNMFLKNKNKYKYSLPKISDVIPSGYCLIDIRKFLNEEIHNFLFYFRFYVPFIIYFIFIGIFFYFYYIGQINLYINAVGLFIFCVLHIPMYLSHPDYSYLVRISVPLYPLTGLIIYLLSINILKYDSMIVLLSDYRMIITIYIYILCILWFLYELCNSISTYLEEINCFKFKTYLPMENARIFTDKNTAKDIIALVDYLKITLNKDEKIFVMPMDSLIFFLSDGKNASYSQAYIYTYDEEVLIKIINDIKSNRPKMIVVNRDQDKIYFPNGLNGHFNLREIARPLYEYVMENYSVINRIGRYEIFFVIK